LTYKVSILNTFSFQVLISNIIHKGFSWTTSNI